MNKKCGNIEKFEVIGIRLIVKFIAHQIKKAVFGGLYLHAHMKIVLPSKSV